MLFKLFDLKQNTVIRSIKKRKPVYRTSRETGTN